MCRLNVKCKTIELSEENTGENLRDSGFDKEFSDHDTKSVVYKRKESIEILQILKLFSAKEPGQGMKKQAIDCNKIFASHL